MKPNTLRWGLLFIAIGMVFIFINLEYLDWDYWLDLLRWWPLLLIAVGIEMIFVRTRLKALAYLSPVILIGAMIWVGVENDGGRIHRHSFFSSYKWQEEIDDAVEKIKATIDHGRSNMRIMRTAFNLASVRVDRFSRKPDVDYYVEDAVAFLEVNNRGRRGTSFVINSRDIHDDWRVSFSDEIPLELKSIGDGSDLNLNLETIPLEKITVENDNGYVYLKIGTLNPSVDISVAGDEAELRLKLPKEAGIKIVGDKYSAYLEKLGYEVLDDGFVSGDYEAAAVKILITLDDNLGSLSIVSY
jgi:hypothetical protein